MYAIAADCSEARVAGTDFGRSARKGHDGFASLNHPTLLLRSSNDNVS
jgi:hypothetical protein